MKRALPLGLAIGLLPATAAAASSPCPTWRERQTMQCMRGYLRVDPAAFVLKLDELRENIEHSSRDTIEFRDGRVFERDTRPQRIDGEVVGRVWCFRDVTDQRRLQAELQHQAFHDPLTGLANKALFRDRVTHAGHRLARSRGRLAVLFIDLDDFKTVNDSLGHSAGDSLLVSVSERISSCLRPGDTAARLG